MVTKNIQKLPKAIVELSITVPWSDLVSKWTDAVQKISSDLELPGFRKGQAPQEMVESRAYQQIQQEFLKVVMPQALVEAMQGSDIVPIDYPQYQIVSFNKGSDLSFKARVTQRPAVRVGNYKVIQALRPVIKPVTDEEVVKIIDDLFKRWKTRLPLQPADPNSPMSPQASSQSSGGSLSFNGPTPQPSAPPPQQVSTTSPVTDSNAPDDNFAKAMGAQSLVDLKVKIKAD